MSSAIALVLAAHLGRVFDAHDDAVRRDLATLPIEHVELGSGGRALGFEIELSNGSKGYFKPEQSFAAHWYAELAAYYVDRALGLGRVPPAIGRKIPWSWLEHAAGRSPHAGEIVVQRDGTVRG